MRFAAGTLVALFPAFRPITGFVGIIRVVFSRLCTLNCISIAFWERELMRAVKGFLQVRAIPVLTAIWEKCRSHPRWASGRRRSSLSRRRAYFACVKASYISWP